MKHTEQTNEKKICGRKKFETPTVSIIRFSTEDILAKSSETEQEKIEGERAYV